MTTLGDGPSSGPEPGRDAAVGSHPATLPPASGPGGAERDVVRQVARSGGVSFLGSALGAVLGFALTLVVARALGDDGAGVVLQAIAVLMISLSLARAGMDTAVVYLVPRLLVSSPADVRGAVVVALVVPLVAGTLCAGLVVAGSVLLDPGDDLARALLASAWALPLGATTVVGLAAMRALGDVVGYVVVGQLCVPFLRPVGVLLAVAWGGAAVAATFAWSASFVVGLVLMLVLLRRRLRLGLGRDAPGGWRPRRAVVRDLLGFAGPRVVSTTLEQAVVWLDVILVGVLVGTAAAGTYGTASRFVAAGLVIDTALRIVVSPVLSRLVHEQRQEECARLFSQVTVWLVLFSAPIYLVLGTYAGVVLGWLGPGFSDGATALAVLCAGAALTLAAGTVHSLLLMSGRSGWSAANKAVVLAVNVVGNLLWLPRGGGIEGAAVVWSVSMLLDAALATVEVRAATGVRLRVGPVARVAAGVLLTVGGPALAARLLLGATTSAVLVSVVAGGLALAAWCVVDRRRLGLHDIVTLRRR